LKESFHSIRFIATESRLQAENIEFAFVFQAN
jgi:hypothetical protein